MTHSQTRLLEKMDRRVAGHVVFHDVSSVILFLIFLF